MVGINNPPQVLMAEVTFHPSMRSLFSLYGWDQQPPQAFMAGVPCHPSMRSLFSLDGWDQQPPEGGKV